MSIATFDPVDERLPSGKLYALGLQHVLVMYGMVAATGIKILAGVDFSGNRSNLFVVAVAIGAGMIPLVAPTFFAQMPKILSPILHSGILRAAIIAVLLNAWFNGGGADADARRDALRAVQAAEH